MDFGRLLFSVNGRISQREFWIGVAIIVVGNILANIIPFLGTILWFALIWVGIAIYGKRLHDAGKTAWLHAVPWAINVVLLIIAFTLIGGAILAAALSGDENFSVITVLAGSGLGLSFLFLGQLVWLGYTIWVGVLKGDVGDNAYGPAPAIEGVAQPASAPEPAQTVEPEQSSDSTSGDEAKS